MSNFIDGELGIDQETGCDYHFLFDSLLPSLSRIDVPYLPLVLSDYLSEEWPARRLRWSVPTAVTPSVS
jgi:hypothetical protein